MKQDCIIVPWLLNIYMDAVIREVQIGIGRMKEEGEYYLVNIICRCLGFVVRVGTRPEGDGETFC